MPWIVKSESNLEKIWAEVSATGHETGEYRKEALNDGVSVQNVSHMPDSVAPVIPILSPASRPSPTQFPPPARVPRARVAFLACTSSACTTLLIALIHHIL